MTSHQEPSPLFTAKLSPPRLRAPSVRPDQLAAISEAANARLLLVRAPAGYGKTTLVAAAAAGLGWDPSWYRLDRLDADPQTFLAGLTLALRAHLPDLGERQDELRARRDDGPAAATQAASALAAELRSAVGPGLHLVLDEYETVAKETAFNEVLATLLAHAPPDVHVLVLGRVRPAFAAARLALEGELNELSHDGLRLDGDQIAAVLEREGAAPAAAHVEALLRLTDGWAAGAVLAGRALNGLDRAGVDEAVAGGGLESAAFPYLAEQVLARQDPGSRRFLFESCCIGQMTAPLAEAVTGIADAGDLLARLEAEGAFTFSGPSADVYHYHPLFQKLLQARLAAESGQAALGALRRRSASLLAREGRAPEAVELYLRAGDLEATVELLRTEGHGLLGTTDQRLLARWADSLRDGPPQTSGWSALLDGHRCYVEGDLSESRRHLDAALAALGDDATGRYLSLRALTNCCYLRGEEDEAATFARAAYEASDGSGQPESLFALARTLSIAGRWRELDEVQVTFEDLDAVPGELAANMKMLALHRAYTSGDVGAALTLAKAALPVVRRHASRLTTANLLNALANFYLFACRYAKGAALLDEARREAATHGLTQMRAQMDVTSAAFLAQSGRLRDCLALLEELLAEPLMQTSASMLLNVCLTEGTALRRAGEADRAVRSYQRALGALRRNDSPFDRLDVQVDLAFMDGVSGAYRHALARLEMLRNEAEGLDLRFQMEKADFFRGVLLLRAGEDGRAQLARSASGLLRLGHRDFLGQELVANPEASTWLASARVSDETLRELLRISALQVGGPALVASLAGRGDRILAILLSLVRTDLPERQASQVLQLLRRNPSRIVRDRARRLDLGAGAATSLFPELTAREEEILALLAEGYSNAQLAQRLVVSLGTVKTHVHRILSKTESKGRLAAAMLYRERAKRPRSGERRGETWVP